MKSVRISLFVLSLLATALVHGAQASNAPELSRLIPAHAVPVPDTISTELKQQIEAGNLPFWNDHPKNTAAWKRWVNANTRWVVQGLPALEKAMEVQVEPDMIAGVRVYRITPNRISAENSRRVLINVHGGGYVLGPGEAATPEAIMMAGIGHVRVIAVDYRMPPDHPYPAALDDAMAVYEEVLKSNNPNHVAIFGTSTGGGLTLAMVLRAKMQGLPLPGAIAAGTPWSDLTKTGDSYFANEYLDDVLVSYDGWLGDAARLYANGHDLKDPMLSPIYGDFHGFPPTFLASGTRDLFLSNTVRVHRKIRDSGGIVDLDVFEGLSHAQYMMNTDSPECRAFFGDASAFFDKYLAR